MPIGLAFIAGGLSTLNPCGFSLLPAMLSLYIAGDESQQGSAASRMSASLRAGARVTAGFLSVFVVVGMPVIFGLGAIVRAIPWAGAVTGVAITVAGILILSGRHIGFSIQRTPVAASRPGRSSMYAFGAAYAIASLGCTLPVFLSVVGASLAVRGPAAATAVLAAYGIGMSTVMMTLALAAGGVRERLVKTLRRALPRMEKTSGALLLAAGIYLSYYWLRILFGPAATLGEDPIVGTVQRFTSRIERIATANATTILSTSVIALAFAAGYILWRKRRCSDDSTSEEVGSSPMDTGSDVAKNAATRAS